MIFVYPWVLALLLLIFLFYRVKKSSVIERVFSKEVLSKLQFGTLSSGKFKHYLLAISFALMVVALARPVVLSSEQEKIDVKSFNFVIALDISKSMEANDVFPSRLLFAKRAIEAIMSRVPEANIALIAYANDAFLVSPFSNDFKSINFLLSNLDTNSITSGGSQILSALKATNHLFESTHERKKSLVLLSDGADGRGLKKIKNYIKKNDITLHVLSIGTKKGRTLSDGRGGLIKDKKGNIVVSKRDDSLANVLNGGAYLSSSGELTKLDWFVKQIKQGVDTKSEKRDRLVGAKELFYYPLSLALVLLFFAFNSFRVPFLMLMFVVQSDMHAGALDFVDIYKGKSSYENKQYKDAQRSFAKVQSKKARYDEANALYKQKKYEKALKTYQSIDGFDKEMEYKRLHNIGNSYANLNKTDEAINSYEKALKLKEDKDTRANLEYMKKKKKEQKKKDKKKSDKKKDKNKKDKNKKDKDKKDKDKKSSDKSKDKEKKQNSDKKPDKNKKPDSKKDDKQKQERQKSDQKKEPQEKRKMSKAEARKWENRMNKKEFKTKPMTVKKGEANEIYW